MRQSYNDLNIWWCGFLFYQTILLSHGHVLLLRALAPWAAVWEKVKVNTEKQVSGQCCVIVHCKPSVNGQLQDSAGVRWSGIFWNQPLDIGMHLRHCFGLAGFVCLLCCWKVRSNWGWVRLNLSTELEPNLQFVMLSKTIHSGGGGSVVVLTLVWLREPSCSYCVAFPENHMRFLVPHIPQVLDESLHLFVLQSVCVWVCVHICVYAWVHVCLCILLFSTGYQTWDLMMKYIWSKLHRM